MGRYRLSKKAEIDLERIWFYGLDTWGMEAADCYHKKLLLHFEKLAENPYANPSTNVKLGYRRSVCGVETVYYRINDEVVEVMAIIGKQDTNIWLA